MGDNHEHPETPPNAAPEKSKRLVDKGIILNSLEEINTALHQSNKLKTSPDLNAIDEMIQTLERTMEKYETNRSESEIYKALADAPQLIFDLEARMATLIKEAPKRSDEEIQAHFEKLQSLRNESPSYLKIFLKEVFEADYGKRYRGFVDGLLDQMSREGVDIWELLKSLGSEPIKTIKGIAQAVIGIADFVSKNPEKAREVAGDYLVNKLKTGRGCGELTALAILTFVIPAGIAKGATKTAQLGTKLSTLAKAAGVSLRASEKIASVGTRAAQIGTMAGIGVTRGISKLPLFSETDFAGSMSEAIQLMLQQNPVLRAEFERFNQASGSFKDLLKSGIEEIEPAFGQQLKKSLAEAEISTPELSLFRDWMASDRNLSEQLISLSPKFFDNPEERGTFIRILVGLYSSFLREEGLPKDLLAELQTFLISLAKRKRAEMRKKAD